MTSRRSGGQIPTWVTGALVAGALLAGGTAASAHHSFAMYDNTKTYKWEGTVVAYDWRNPHIYVDVIFPRDNNRQWSLEGTAIPMLTRLGWTSKTVKAGDKVTAQFAPMRNGTAAGVLMELTFADGRVINTGLPGQSNYAKPQ